VGKSVPGEALIQKFIPWVQQMSYMGFICIFSVSSVAMILYVFLCTLAPLREADFCNA